MRIFRRLRRTQFWNVVTIQGEDGTVYEQIRLAPPTRYGPNTCTVVITPGTEYRIADRDETAVRRG